MPAIEIAALRIHAAPGEKAFTAGGQMDTCIHLQPGSTVVQDWDSIDR
ncbi:MAG: hypothetical protein ABSD75_04705 [Terriglobales bacterium]